MTRTLIFVLFATFWSSDSAAQQTWSLEKCINHALNESIPINQSRLNVELAEIDKNQSIQGRYPTLNGNTNVNWNFGRTIDPTTNDFITSTFFANNFGLSTGIPIFNGFQINNSIKQSDVELNAAKADMAQSERDVALQVATQFLNIVFAQENINLSDKQLQLAQNELDQLQKLIAAGSRPPADKLTLEASIAQNEQMRITAINNLEISLLQLKQSLRLPPDYDLELEIPNNVNVESDPDLLTFDELFSAALQNQPSIEASQMRVVSAEYGKKLAQGAGMPSINLFGSLNTAYSNQGFIQNGVMDITVLQPIKFIPQDPTLPMFVGEIETEQTVPIIEKQTYSGQLDNNLSYGFGIGVNVPIYNRGSVKANVERSEISRASAALNYDMQVENLKITMQQVLADARAAKKKLEASTKTVDAQQLSYDNILKRIDIGASSTFELNNQRVQLENAQLTQLIDKYDYLFKTKILDFYLGKPLKL